METRDSSAFRLESAQPEPDEPDESEQQTEQQPEQQAKQNQPQQGEHGTAQKAEQGSGQTAGAGKQSDLVNFSGLSGTLFESLMDSKITCRSSSRSVVLPALPSRAIA